MTKLSSYYTLCPLIDQQNLLGVEKDAEPGCVIVTLGWKMIKRYKLQDLKEISGWASKKLLSAQVVYDSIKKKYMAVFNEKSISIWSETDVDLDKVKRFKFQNEIYKILTLDGISPILVLKNGATASLEWALANRKNWENKCILQQGEQILQCQLLNVNQKIYLCALTKIEDSHNYIVIKLQSDNYFGDLEELTRIDLKYSNEKLMGHFIHQVKNNAYLLTLWEHKRLYSYPLLSRSSEPIPGNLISVITIVNAKHPVVIVPLTESTIAMYGADATDEGAVLVIYNIEFKLVQAAQKLKLYTKDAKMWRIDDKLLLAANKHLAVISLRLAAQKLGAIVGSSLHMKNNNVDEDIMVIQETTVENWENKSGKSKLSDTVKRLSSQLPKRVAKLIATYINEGIDDADIQENLIIDLIEAKDVPSILCCLDNFRDLPEKLLTKLLLFCLRAPNNTFQPVTNGTTDDTVSCKVSSRYDFLDKIFTVANSDIYLMNCLKTSLNFVEVLSLLDYIVLKLDDDNHAVADDMMKPMHKQLYEWASLLLDSHYQQYLLSQDPKVLKVLNKLNSVLEIHYQLLKDLENIRPMLKRAIDGKSLKTMPKNTNKFYSIEEVKLY